MSFHDDVVMARRRAAARPLPAGAFGRLCWQEQRPDVVVVTAPDHAHAELVGRALAAGADVVVEKPLTIDAAGARDRGGGRRARRRRDVTFNYRYAPAQLPRCARSSPSGAIGEVTSVHFEWVLDTVHGADYFRRWHRDKENSGGLLVHKSSHHFDLVNWWLGDVPARVFARGGLRFYGDRNAADRGLGAATGAAGTPASPATRSRSTSPTTRA